MIKVKESDTEWLFQLVEYAVDDADEKGVINEELGNQWGDWMADEWDMDDGSRNELNELFKKFIGYKVKYYTDGSHKNDGQMVEYTFNFESPTGELTRISTEMCLMVGWNYHTDIIIN